MMPIRIRELGSPSTRNRDFKSSKRKSAYFSEQNYFGLFGEIRKIVQKSSLLFYVCVTILVCVTIRGVTIWVCVTIRDVTIWVCVTIRGVTIWVCLTKQGATF